jgi:hypothetical protein
MIFGLSNANANPIVFTMNTVEWTGNRQLVYPPDGMGEGMEPNAPPGSYYIYEIKCEWYYSKPGTCPVSSTALYRNNSQIVGSVNAYSCTDGYDYMKKEYWLAANYRYYDWVPAGTYSYKAFDGSSYTNTKNVTVP